jgi:phospholipid/cholesterol/gamma-HCH transport system substrate-binding protein
MFKGDRNFTVGLFVSIAIAVFIGFVIWLTGRSATEEMTRYSLLFERDVSGLAVGGPVKYMGMNIGSVVQMKLERNDTVNVRVDIEVLESTPVDSGTYASLALQGITGVAVVNLASDPGEHPPIRTPPGREYPVIPVRLLGFSAVVSSMPEIMSKLDVLLTRAGELLNEENRAAVGGALTDLNAVTAALAENREAIAGIPGDLRATLADVQSTVGQLEAVIGQMKPGLDATLSNIQKSSENLVSLTGRIDTLLQDHQADMGRFLSEGLGEAPALMKDARLALREMEKLIAELKDEPSQLIHRPPAADAIDIEP